MTRDLQFNLSNVLRKYSGLLAIFFVVAVFHILSYNYVAAFYRSNLPHYDSMGSYTTMFGIMNLFHAEGFLVALTVSSTHFLSWLQSLFALLSAPFLSATPEGVQLLNTLALLTLMLGIYTAAKAYGAGEVKAYLLSLMVFLPDVFFDWWGGMMDMRRDFAFVSLLGATFFIFFAFIRRPTRAISMMLGLLSALVVYSRDNSIFLLALIMVPIASFFVLADLKNRRLSILKGLAPGVGVGIILIIPWAYANLSLTLERRLNPFVIYGAGDSPWRSLVSHWDKPLALMFGRLGPMPTGNGGWSLLSPLGEALGADWAIRNFGPYTLPLTMLLLSMIGVTFLTQWRNMRMESKVMPLSLMASGAWALMVTYFVICYVVGLMPLDYSSAQIPFFPSLLFFFALFFVVGMAISAKGVPSQRGLAMIAVAVTLLVMAFSILRMEAKAPEPTARYVGVAQRLISMFAESGKDVSVAYLWHDTISIDTLLFYSAQSGAQTHFRKFTYSFDGRELDFAVALPNGVDPAKMSDSVRRQIESRADYVVLNASKGIYSQDRHDLFLFRYGQQTVDSLLQSSRFKRVYEFDLWAKPFVVLKRRRSDE